MDCVNLLLRSGFKTGFVPIYVSLSVDYTINSSWKSYKYGAG